MCSIELLAVLQAFSVSDFSPDWKSAPPPLFSLPGGPVVGLELRTHEQGTSLQVIVGELHVVFICNTKVCGQVTDPDFEKR